MDLIEALFIYSDQGREGKSNGYYSGVSFILNANKRTILKKITIKLFSESKNQEILNYIKKAA